MLRLRRFLANKLPVCFDFAQLACALSEVEGQNLKGRIFSGNHLRVGLLPVCPFKSSLNQALPKAIAKSAHGQQVFWTAWIDL